MGIAVFDGGDLVRSISSLWWSFQGRCNFGSLCDLDLDLFDRDRDLERDFLFRVCEIERDLDLDLDFLFRVLDFLDLDLERDLDLLFRS